VVTTPIRAVVFDIGDVLEISGIQDNPRWDPLREAISVGKIEGHPTEEQIAGMLSMAYGLDEADAAQLLQALWGDYLGTPDTELIAYFAALRPAFRTALLSNSMHGARAQEQARYGFGDLTDLIVYSHEEGISKPDPRIYEITCTRLGVAPQEAVFVDDAPRCIEGARDFGMQTVLHQSTPQTIAALDEMLGLRRG
jgi:putative hydrolase of the HAD superfamily